MMGSQVLVLAAIIVVLFIVLFIRLRKGIRAGQRSRDYAMPAEKKSSLGNRIITFFVLLYSLYQLYKLSTTTTVLDIKWIVAVLVGLIILAIVVLRRAYSVSPKLKRFFIEAKQSGASHFSREGPAIFFYRIHEGKTEYCFAELTGTEGYGWIQGPTDWKECKELPSTAKPIPKKI